MNKRFKRLRRQRHIRKKVMGTVDRPRLTVFRSNAHIYAQVIDDTKGQTLASVSDLTVEIKGKKVEKAFEVGKKVAELALKKGVQQVVFDKGGYLYHGRVLKLAEGARSGGLQF